MRGRRASDGAGALHWARLARRRYAPAAEAILAADTSPAAIAAAVQAAVAAARPIDDIRAGAAYRRAMVGVLARRGIETVLAQAGG